MKLIRDSFYEIYCKVQQNGEEERQPEAQLFRHRAGSTSPVV